MRRVFQSLGSLFALFILFQNSAMDSHAASWHFTATSDVHNAQTAFQHVLAQINTQVSGPGDFHITTGDVVNGDAGIDAAEDLVSLQSAFGPSIIWYTVLGNHDILTPSEVDWFHTHLATIPGLVHPGPTGTSLTAYSFEHRNAHFVVLNEYFDGTNETGTDGDIEDVQYEWLAADLASNKKPIVVVFGHEPAYPVGRHVGDSLDKYTAHRDRFWSLLESNNVAAYLCGHTHVRAVTQITDGKTWEVTNGAAGLDYVQDGYSFVNATVEDHSVRFDTWNGADSGPMSLTSSVTYTSTAHKSIPAANASTTVSKNTGVSTPTMSQP
jgi:Icc-related predicted phosphoesterase